MLHHSVRYRARDGAREIATFTAYGQDGSAGVSFFSSDPAAPALDLPYTEMTLGDAEQISVKMAQVFAYAVGADTIITHEEATV